MAKSVPPKNKKISVRDILKNFEDSLQLSYDQINSDELPLRDKQDLDINAFWIQMTGATKLISHEATKIRMAFVPPGIDSVEACQSLVNGAEKICSSFLSVFLTFSAAHGKTVHREVKLYVLSVLRSLKKLYESLRNGSVNQFATVGDVWEKCEGVEKLPKDNKEAVAEKCYEQHKLLQDVMEELDDSISDDIPVMTTGPENGIIIPTLNEKDKKIIASCINLVRAADACLKKTKSAVTDKGDVTTEVTVKELDDMAERVTQCSPLVDDLAFLLNPPLDCTSVIEQCQLVHDNMKTLLLIVQNSHICTEESMQWIKFLNKAVDHNWNCVNRACTDP